MDLLRVILRHTWCSEVNNIKSGNTYEIMRKFRRCGFKEEKQMITSLIYECINRILRTPQMYERIQSLMKISWKQLCQNEGLVFSENDKPLSRENDMWISL